MAFRKAYEEMMTEKNIKAGFQNTYPLPKSYFCIMSKLDVKLQTSTSIEPSPAETNIWVPQALQRHFVKYTWLIIV